jgi:hypothetical protein
MHGVWLKPIQFSRVAVDTSVQRRNFSNHALKISQPLRILGQLGDSGLQIP